MKEDVEKKGVRTYAITENIVIEAEAGQCKIIEDGKVVGNCDETKFAQVVLKIAYERNLCIE